MIDWKSYQGVDVIEAQKGVLKRHPRWGWDTPVEFQNVTLLLLADDTELVICDLCTFNGITGYEPYAKPETEKTLKEQSNKLLSHFSGKHWVKKPRGSYYTDDQIRTVIKIWLKWRSTKISNWTQRAIDELNGMGIKPYRGDTWTRGAVSSLAKVYAKNKKFKNVKAASLTEADKELIRKLARGAASEPEKENEVPVGEGNPTLSFGAGGGGGLPGMTIAVGAGGGQGKNTSGGHQVATPVMVPGVEAPEPAPVPAEASEVLYKHLGELEDGTPIFQYLRKKNGHRTWIMMAGKRIKGIEI